MVCARAWRTVRIAAAGWSASISGSPARSRRWVAVCVGGWGGGCVCVVVVVGGGGGGAEAAAQQQRCLACLPACLPSLPAGLRLCAFWQPSPGVLKPQSNRLQFGKAGTGYDWAARDADEARGWGQRRRGKRGEAVAKWVASR